MLPHSPPCADAPRQPCEERELLGVAVGRLRALPAIRIEEVVHLEREILVVVSGSVGERELGNTDLKKDRGELSHLWRRGKAGVRKGKASVRRGRGEGEEGEGEGESNSTDSTTLDCMLRLN